MKDFCKLLCNCLRTRGKRGRRGKGGGRERGREEGGGGREEGGEGGEEGGEGGRVVLAQF